MSTLTRSAERIALNDSHQPLLDAGTRAVRDLEVALHLLAEFHRIGGLHFYEAAREQGLWAVYQNLIARQPQ